MAWEGKGKVKSSDLNYAVKSLMAKETRLHNASPLKGHRGVSVPSRGDSIWHKFPMLGVAPSPLQHAPEPPPFHPDPPALLCPHCWLTGVGRDLHHQHPMWGPLLCLQQQPRSVQLCTLSEGILWHRKASPGSAQATQVSIGCTQLDCALTFKTESGRKIKCSIEDF